MLPYHEHAPWLLSLITSDVTILIFIAFFCTVYYTMCLFLKHAVFIGKPKDCMNQF